MNTLKQRLLAIAGIALALTTSVQAEELTAADVAALPQDKVRTIIKECHFFSTNLVVQDWCESTQLEALKRIVERGTYQSSNDEKDDRNRVDPARESLKKALIERGRSIKLEKK